MRQVLFHGFFVPVFGYGFMLFLAYIFCSWLAVRQGRREGIPRPEPLRDLAIWLFVGGIIGARATFVTHFWAGFQGNPWQVLAFWDGGLIFYGSIPGAIFAYAVFYWINMRQDRVSHWKMADVVAPCLALGLCLGRIGCLLNGCCYGNVACAHCPAIHFPLPSAPRYDMVKRGYQTVAGFVVARNSPTVQVVEPGSAAERSGLKSGDEIVKVHPGNQELAFEIRSSTDLATALYSGWPRGHNELALKVRNPTDGERELTFVPRGIGLHPTQVYESVSMVLLLAFLLTYMPLKSRDGELMVYFMAGYAVHRFLNEMLRTDTEQVAFGMTLSQNISVIVFGVALVLAGFVWRPMRASGPTPPANLAESTIQP